MISTDEKEDSTFLWNDDGDFLVKGGSTKIDGTPRKGGVVNEAAAWKF